MQKWTYLTIAHKRKKHRQLISQKAENQVTNTERGWISTKWGTKTTKKNIKYIELKFGSLTKNLILITLKNLM